MLYVDSHIKVYVPYWYCCWQCMFSSTANVCLFVFVCVLLWKQKGVLNRAIDIGCAVGRLSFELAREFDEVVGMDYSQAFIAKCQEMKMTGQAKYSLTVEGCLTEEKVAVVDPTIVGIF